MCDNRYFNNNEVGVDIENKINLSSSFRSRCVLPEHPNFGRWSTENGSLLPGMSVLAGTTLDVECDDGYVVDGNNRTSCQDQKWTPTVGTCSSNFR
jgi:hypothetical protein